MEPFLMFNEEMRTPARSDLQTMSAKEPRQDSCLKLYNEFNEHYDFEKELYDEQRQSAFEPQVPQTHESAMLEYQQALKRGVEAESLVECALADEEEFVEKKKKKSKSKRREKRKLEAEGASAPAKLMKCDEKPNETPTMRQTLESQTVEIARQSEFNRLIVNCCEDARVAGGARDKRFANYVYNSNYYMFIVSEDAERAFKVTYANCVWCIKQDYRRNYRHVDNKVMVLSIDKCRFMISYKLLKKMNVYIPPSEDIERQLSTATEETREDACYFNEIKDFEFLTLLINTFHLDMCYTRVKMFMLLSSMGDAKSKLLWNWVYGLIKDETLFHIPVNYGHRQPIVEEDFLASPAPDCVASASSADSEHVKSIVSAGEGLSFKVAAAQLSVEQALDSVKFWLRVKSNDAVQKTKDCYINYKYACIVRLLYDERDRRIANLLKIKKPGAGTAELVEYYLNVCAKLPRDSQNFLLVTTKNEERLSLVKNGPRLVWISGVARDICVGDIINKFDGQFEHHVFKLNKVSRKELNNRHNGLLKLVSLYTSAAVDLSVLVEIAQTQFECDYRCSQTSM
ncbi:IE-1 [Lymantria xylina nucleopolyhedrovirus]|uniref:IE-1 n=1 Tax=Lymantria xylina multiple nucleopolyhedrovirus TaxID=2847840 RepID=D4N249_9ABAC|nr:IE-1 [Lymantria xylina nucleopolyhedrovirus]ADD73721.1 IE-1 [Lymantria xylina nucleopolyhedrovirus]